MVKEINIQKKCSATIVVLGTHQASVKPRNSVYDKL